MIGEKIHNYQINAHLGQGGMGNVFRATDIMLGREVALKMLHPQLTIQSQFLERFKKEARVLAQLLHPNIAVIYNFIEQGGNHFMVMEYVDGTNLDDLLKRYKALPPEFVIPVFIQALEGLQHAHRKNIFHRDIKPSNLMLTPDGTVKLMDFGIAKIAGEQKMTQVNKIVGTVEFMAPELIEGKDASASSDIYSMGVTLYELISGKLPFEADTDFNLMQAIMKKKVKPLDKLNASIPKTLSDIVMKALEKNPGSRYADARAFQQALIMAFPHFREINLAALRTATPATQIVQRGGAITQPNKNLMTAAAMETKVETWAKPLSILGTVKQKIEKNKKRYLIAASVLLFLIITSIWVIKSDSGKKIIEARIDSLNQNGQNKQNEQGNLTGDNGTTTETIIPKENVNVPPPQNNSPTIVSAPIKQEPEKQKEKKPVAKDPVVKEEEDNKETVAPPPVVEKPVEKRDVYIQSKVEVNLSLRTNLDDAPERKEIPVNFSVSSPVIYQGVTIIKQGALASGTIKLGKVQTDIEITTVTAANGQQIRLKALRGHGKRSDISSNRSYTAIIQPGTRMSF